RPASEAAAILAREYPALSLGLHLELPTDHPERGDAEIERQVTRFEELVGGHPTHLDAHHNAHHDPRFLPAVLAWGRRTALPVRGHSDVSHISKFYGQWGGETHLEQIGVESLIRLLDEEVRSGVTELACHPGHVESGFPSSYAAEREVELRTLCDAKVRQAIVERESGLAVSLAGVLHAQGAAIVNPYPVTLALSDKIVTFRVLQRAGAPLPDTYVFSEPITVAPLLETGPLIVKPVRGWDGHGVRIISKASELADLPARKEPMFAQRYIPPEGRELKMFATGGRVLGVRRDVQR